MPRRKAVKLKISPPPEDLEGKARLSPTAKGARIVLIVTSVIHGLTGKLL